MFGHIMDFRFYSTPYYAARLLTDYDTTIGQLFESLLGTPVDLNKNINMLLETSIKDDKVYAWDTDWMAIALLDEEYMSSECMKLYIDKDGKDSIYISELTRNINNQYPGSQVTTKNSADGFLEDIVIPFKKNRLILIEANLWHSVNFKDKSKIIHFLIRRRA